MLSRLIPMARHACAFSVVISPGLASMVISMESSCTILNHFKQLCTILSIIPLSTVLGVPPPMYRVCTGSDTSCWRICPSASKASTYCACFSRWVVEKKSQYLQRLLQNGICMYIPATICCLPYSSAATIPFANGWIISISLMVYPLVMAAMPHPSAGLHMMILRSPYASPVCPMG